MRLFPIPVARPRMDILQSHLAHAAEPRNKGSQSSSTTAQPSHRGKSSTNLNGILNRNVGRHPSRQLPQARFIEHERRYGGFRHQLLEKQRKDAARTDIDYLLQHHKFVQDAAPSDLETWAKEVRDAALVAAGKKQKKSNEDWAQKMARNYDRHLFKEYALADVSRFKTGQVGLRWRTEKEVVSGKGESECANLACAEHHGLAAFEVNFAYVEGNPPVRKNTLVKLMLCPDCGYKLNYKKLKLKAKEAVKLAKRRRRKKKKKKKKKVKLSLIHI